MCRCINEVLCCHLYCKKISPPTLRRQLEGITGFLLLSSNLGTTRSFSSIPWINCNSIMSSVRGFLYMYIQGTILDCADTLCWSSLTFFFVLSSSYNVSNGLPTAINPLQFIEISLSDVYMDFYWVFFYLICCISSYQIARSHLRSSLIYVSSAKLFPCLAICVFHLLYMPFPQSLNCWRRPTNYLHLSKIFFPIVP